jgi:hypothetical protein
LTCTETEKDKEKISKGGWLNRLELSKKIEIQLEPEKEGERK